MTGSSPATQLPLQLRLDESATLENFSPSAATGALCATLPLPDGEPLHFLHGAAETGKSHLLQAACRIGDGRALYLPLQELAAVQPVELLRDLEHCQRLAIDDLQQVAGDAAWEEALFHLVNRCRAARCQLLLAARRPPGQLGVRLPDLRSRLAGGLTWALPAHTDADRARILSLRAERRGLVLSPSVVEYLCRRASRSLVDLLAILDRLDEASLQRQRPVTVPLVRQVMGW